MPNDESMSTPRRVTPSGLTFLSGGSALNDLASLLARSQLHATHVLSVFDNGGSTGRLRDAYRGIAIGDLRKRLVAIGDRTASPARAFIDLLCMRLPQNQPASTLRATVQAYAAGDGDPGALPATLAAEVSQALSALLATAPDSFDWRDCSVGNLILTGRYLQTGEWGAALAWAHDAVSARGEVVPVTTAHAHLGARLTNGRYVLGQRVVTDEVTPIDAPIASLALHRHDASASEPVRASAYAPALRALEAARLVVYAWGSFYTSVLSSLLVEGIGGVLSASRARKVLLLNPFTDAETRGKRPVNLVRDLLDYVAAGNGHGTEPALTHVLALRLPGANGKLYDPGARRALESLGVDVVEVESAGIPGAGELERVMDHLLALAATAPNQGSNTTLPMQRRCSK